MDRATRPEIEELEVGDERVLELREEQLVANKQLRELGEVVVRTEVDAVPARLEVEALREEVEVVHEPVGETVAERDAPWVEGDVVVLPIYEEQLVVSKRLVLRERLRVRRVRTTERQLFEDTVRRERLVVDDARQTARVHEVYPTDKGQASRSDDEPHDGPVDNGHAAETRDADGNFLTKLVSRALE